MPLNKCKWIGLFKQEVVHASATCNVMIIFTHVTFISFEMVLQEHTRYPGSLQG